MPPVYRRDAEEPQDIAFAGADIPAGLGKLLHAAASTIEVSVKIPIGDSDDSAPSLQLSPAAIAGQRVRLMGEMKEMERRLVSRVVDACLWLHLDKYFTLKESNPTLRLHEVPYFFDRVFFTNERESSLAAKTLGSILFPSIYPGRVVIETDFPEDFIKRFSNEVDRRWFGCGIELRPSPAAKPSPQGAAQCRTTHDRGHSRVDGGVTITLQNSAGVEARENFFLTCEHSVQTACPSVVWSATPDWMGNCPDVAFLRPAAKCGPKQNGCAKAFDTTRKAEHVRVTALDDALGKAVYLFYKGRRRFSLVNETVRDSSYTYRRANGELGVMRFPHFNVTGPFFSRERDSGGWVLSRDGDEFVGWVTHGPSETSGGGDTKVHAASSLVSYLEELFKRSSAFGAAQSLGAGRRTAPEFWLIR
jgi:hypothetical protein